MTSRGMRLRLADLDTGLISRLTLEVNESLVDGSDSSGA